MQSVFETFVERLSVGVDEVDFRAALASTISEFDIPAFAYLSLPLKAAGTPRLISNYPPCWTSHYMRNRYDTIDPVIVQARGGKHPFRWGSDFGRHGTSKPQQRLFDEAAEFGIRCGLTIPIHDRRGRTAAVTFAADESSPTFFRVAERYEQALQLMATCFHIGVRKKLSADRVVDGVLLTHREYECLQWAARGKSAGDIGSILGITRRTASFHLDNAKKKLGVRTVVQAVARLAASRFSNPGQT
ncbi:DNA-binding CsgD family transcriptional regulator [Mesorhizobium sp. J18]|uniref:LuxR family transcriptional regulator n=1 Tax=Mesorhizobium sp. J18 TaxID=935263 RepID=UPI00119A430B|nr:LuxR family transcriptional regulator [Mesorhizobium sp. J18]TWG95972.1 DNA-binding CsgD family transcriptional regulator [Mesorhizobium sp. J18]